MSALSARFLEAAKEWICDGYFADIRCISKANETPQILCASIHISPLPHNTNDSFSLEFGRYYASRLQTGPHSQSEIMSLLEHLAKGQLEIQSVKHSLVNFPNINHYSDGEQRDRWFQPLHLRVHSPNTHVFSATELLRLDDVLRCCEPPFDGIDDLCSLLGLPSLNKGEFRPQIDVHIGPPIDLIWNESSLHQESLSITLRAHNNLDTSKINLGLKITSGFTAPTRLHVAQQIKWTKENDHLKTGRLNIATEGAHSALIMLCIEQTTVRRQWFIDPSKSINVGFAVTNYFDKDLRRLKKAIFEDNQSKEFEKAIASLAYILGFSPSMQLESDAPDILMTTPLGRLVLVECTFRTSDIITKAGKLADRRIGLINFLSSQNDIRDVFSILAIRESSFNPALHLSDLKSLGVHLVTREGLEEALLRANGPPNPDALLDEVVNWRWSEPA